ncbi:hypothetical protein CyaNS01_01927 [Cyanobium sp. NS01]|nr:hypothetical protein CyaNS01_01927 [Cyanobium sp. NS01]
MEETLTRSEVLHEPYPFAQPGALRAFNQWTFCSQSNKWFADP